MKKLVVFIFLIFFNCACCFTQEESVKWHNNIQHNLFFEFLGNNWLGANITYDCSFKIREKHKIAIGFGGVYLPTREVQAYGIYPQLNYLYGKKHHLELGTGYSNLWNKDEWGTSSAYFGHTRSSFRSYPFTFLVFRSSKNSDKMTHFLS